MPSGIYIRTAEIRAKNSVSSKKNWQNSEYRAKNSAAQKIAQNRPEVKARKSAAQKIAQKVVQNRPEVRAKNSAAQKIAQNRPEVKAKIAIAQKVAQNRPEVRARKSAAQNRPEVKKKKRAAAKKNWQDPEYVSKQMKARGVSPNEPEKFLNKLFQQLLSNQIRYTGDGKDEDFIVAGKAPDFMFIDGQKKIIEHFGDWWHGEKFTGIPNEQHEQERIDLFAKEGYQTLVIWERELKDIEVLEQKILIFCKRKGD